MHQHNLVLKTGFDSQTAKLCLAEMCWRNESGNVAADHFFKKWAAVQREINMIMLDPSSTKDEKTRALERQAEIPNRVNTAELMTAYTAGSQALFDILITAINGRCGVTSMVLVEGNKISFADPMPLDEVIRTVIPMTEDGQLNEQCYDVHEITKNSYLNGQDIYFVPIDVERAEGAEEAEDGNVLVSSITFHRP